MAETETKEMRKLVLLSLLLCGCAPDETTQDAPRRTIGANVGNVNVRMVEIGGHQFAVAQTINGAAAAAICEVTQTNSVK